MDTLLLFREVWTLWSLFNTSVSYTLYIFSYTLLILSCTPLYRGKSCGTFSWNWYDKVDCQLTTPVFGFSINIILADRNDPKVVCYELSRYMYETYPAHLLS